MAGGDGGRQETLTVLGDMMASHEGIPPLLQLRVPDGRTDAPASGIPDPQRVRLLRLQLREQKARLAAQQKTIASLTERVSDAVPAVQAETLKAQNADLKNTVSRLQSAQDALKGRATRSPQEVRDYAVGTSVAKDILALFREREAQGVKVSRALALAGIRDTFSGHYQVPEKDREAALAASEQDIRTRERALKEKTERAGEQYRAAWQKRPGVKRAAEGYLYRVERVGVGSAIGDNDTVTVVVKEALTDGTVVSDMAAKGAVMTQALNHYPPLFRSAIRLAGGKGKVTMVVPPSLAYGDDGYPPAVPPGATMVYTLQVNGVAKNS
ncbi:FKBP-type peptidyl-prolyl cis-trans isomerase N-terminal domain-containing protein (plasmid) [Klebsiella oxytoca]|uniref:FKBP-type peptidyl-prolyl cis-trans isomerase N-terminal domain-containing protein n=1 Tax=Klebsiella oxytoca TaxID=571 RepID=UPI003982BAE2